MMKIINQEGNALYPLDNLTCVRCDGCFVKVMLLMPMMRTDGAEQIPQIIVAEYENQETAQREFDKFIARCAITGDKGVYQFPAKSISKQVAEYGAEFGKAFCKGFQDGMLEVETEDAERSKNE